MSDLNASLESLNQVEFIDNQRVAEGPSPSIAFDPSIDFDYQERLAYETRWADELNSIQQLVKRHAYISAHTKPSNAFTCVSIFFV